MLTECTCTVLDPVILELPSLPDNKRVGEVVVVVMGEEGLVMEVVVMGEEATYFCSNTHMLK